MDMPSQLLNVSVSETNRQMRDRVLLFLKNRNNAAFENFHVDANDGVVTLFGRTRTFYEKQIVLTLCRNISGVCKLIDRIAVKPVCDTYQANAVRQ